MKRKKVENRKNKFKTQAIAPLVFLRKCPRLMTKVLFSLPDLNSPIITFCKLENAEKGLKGLLRIHCLLKMKLC